MDAKERMIAATLKIIEYLEAQLVNHRAALQRLTDN